MLKTERGGRILERELLRRRAPLPPVASTELTILARTWRPDGFSAANRARERYESTLQIIRHLAQYRVLLLR